MSFTDIHKQAHLLSSEHRDAVDSSALCGCFYCVTTFKPEHIVEWCDSGETALCPRCGIDSVLPESEIYELTIEFLYEMKKEWFSMVEEIRCNKKQ